MADEARAAAATPLPKGPLTGVPFLLKDLVVAGVPTGCGSRLLDGWTRDYDSEILLPEASSSSARPTRLS